MTSIFIWFTRRLRRPLVNLNYASILDNNLRLRQFGANVIPHLDFHRRIVRAASEKRIDFQLFHLTELLLEVESVA